MRDANQIDLYLLCVSAFFFVVAVLGTIAYIKIRKRVDELESKIQQLPGGQPFTERGTIEYRRAITEVAILGAIKQASALREVQGDFVALARSGSRGSEPPRGSRYPGHLIRDLPAGWQEEGYTKRVLSSDPCEYRVWFGTDRRPIREDDYLLGFTDDYSKDLHFGSCVVHIPKSHEFGSLGSPFLIRIAKRAIGKRADEPLKLLAIETGTQESFVRDLQGCVDLMPETSREIALFVHGYNVDFQTAAIRAAQIGKDLNLPGPMTLYSWPSKAAAKAYTIDEATIDRTLPKFIEFLHVLLSIPGLDALNIIAHSMGNRLVHLTWLLSETAALSPLLGHVVLAASDIDRETFKRAADGYKRLRASHSRRMTIYYSDKDRALGASDLVHGDPRLGQLGAGLPGADAIRWISPMFNLDMLGHSYFAEAKPVLQDIRDVLVFNKMPKDRPNLKPVPSDVPLYYELKG